MSWKIEDYAYFDKNRKVLTVSPGTVSDDLKKQLSEFSDIRFQEKELKESYMIPIFNSRKKVKRKKKTKKNYKNK